MHGCVNFQLYNRYEMNSCKILLWIAIKVRAFDIRAELVCQVRDKKKTKFSKIRE